MNALAPYLRRSRRGKSVAALLLAAFSTLSGCVSSAVSSPPEAAPETGTVFSPILSMPESPPAPVVPGTGVLSHAHEERDIRPRAVLVASSRLAAKENDAAKEASAPRAVRPPSTLHAPSPIRHEMMLPGPFPEADVYALSPHARLLSHAPGPHMSLPRHPAGHAGLPDSPRPAPAEWAKLAREAEEIFGLDSELVLAVIRAESAFDHTAVSPVGAQGAMQVMPLTQEQLGLIDPFDPRANVYAGTQYLMELMQRFGSVELALAAYNAGPANVEKYGGIPPFPETRDFVRRVTRYWETEKNTETQSTQTSAEARSDRNADF